MKRGLSYREGKRGLLYTPKVGTALGVCATFNRRYLCCHVHVLRSVQNCPYECTYCFLQNYLTDGQMKVVSDTHALMEEVRGIATGEPWRLFRIGTWELGDSLALERESGQAAELIGEFAGLENAVLELKTKSAVVEGILGVEHGERTVVSWSLNTPFIIEREERGTASLEARIKAVRKVAQAGYLLGFHFDPMIFYPRWREDYTLLVREVFRGIPPDRIAWISIGSLRFNPEMKRLIESNYPDTGITAEEMITGDDGKMRYVKPLRLEMYRQMYAMIHEAVGDDPLVYLCMERWDVWERVLGFVPDSIGHLDYIFARSLWERYGIGPGKPERALYEKAWKDEEDEKRTAPSS